MAKQTKQKSLLHRMCGIATLIARHVTAVAGFDARIVEPRKKTEESKEDLLLHSLSSWH